MQNLLKNPDYIWAQDLIKANYRLIRLMLSYKHNNATVTEICGRIAGSHYQLTMKQKEIYADLLQQYYNLRSREQE